MMYRCDPEQIPSSLSEPPQLSHMQGDGLELDHLKGSFYF